MTFKEVVNKVNNGEVVHVDFGGRRLVTLGMKNECLDIVRCLDIDAGEIVLLNFDNMETTLDEYTPDKVKVMSTYKYKELVLKKYAGKIEAVPEDKYIIKFKNDDAVFILGRGELARELGIFLPDKVMYDCSSDDGERPAYFMTKSYGRVLIVHRDLYGFMGCVSAGGSFADDILSKPIEVIDTKGNMHHICDYDEIQFGIMLSEIDTKPIHEDDVANLVASHVIDSTKEIYMDCSTVMYGNTDISVTDVALALGYHTYGDANICVDAMHEDTNIYSVRTYNASLKNVLIVSHNDSDGVMSAALIANYVTRIMHCTAHIRLIGNSRADATTKAINNFQLTYSHLFVLDRALSPDDIINKKCANVTYIDHHQSNHDALMHVLENKSIQYDDISYSDIGFAYGATGFFVPEYNTEIMYNGNHSAAMQCFMYIIHKCKELGVTSNQFFGSHKLFANEIVRVDRWDTHSFKERTTPKSILEYYPHELALSAYDANFLLPPANTISGNMAFNSRDICEVLSSYINLSVCNTPFSDDQYAWSVYSIKTREIAEYADNIINKYKATKTPKCNVIVSPVFIKRTDVADVFNYLDERIFKGEPSVVLFRENPTSNIVQVRANTDVLDAVVKLGGGGHPKACGFSFNTAISSTKPETIEQLINKYNDVLCAKFVDALKD